MRIEPSGRVVPEEILVGEFYPKQVYNWMKEGRVEYVRIPAGSRRILVDSLEQRRKEYRKNS